MPINLFFVRYSRLFSRRNNFPTFVSSLIPCKSISTTNPKRMIEIEEKHDGKVISISGKQVQSDRVERLICVPNDLKACPLCRLGLKVTFADVLILEQFMRSDGTVLPSDVTGLCKEQQTAVEHSIQQAHWSGLFPSMKPKGYEAKLEELGYKQFRRHWTKPEELFERKLDLRPGSWFYIKRY